MDRNTLDEILRKHKLWLDDDPEGEYISLCYADLHGLDLRNADFYFTELNYIDLSGADLRGASLRYAKLTYANLRGADLRGADLYDAYLSGVDLTGVKVDETTKWFNNRCPAEGAYIGYKKCRGGLIVELEIPADAKRSSATTEKCRASKAKVIGITNLDGSPSNVKKAVSFYDRDFVYFIGETIEIPDFDEDHWRKCSRGIHHFMTRKESVNYLL